MKNKKILLIGDLRNASNWGAQITSTEVINWLKSKNPLADFEYITERSWVENTPPNGPKIIRKKNLEKIKWYLKKILWRLGFLTKLNFSKKIIKNTEDLEKLKKDEDHIPDEFSEFESFWKKMVIGEILVYEFKLLNQADEIYISSEGSIVNTTPNKRYRRSGRYNLFMSWVAKIKLKKPTYLINHTYDPKNIKIDEIARNVYPFLDKALLREKLSLENLNRIIRLRDYEQIHFFPDFAFNIKKSHLEKSKDLTICIGDSAGLKKVNWDVYSFYDKIFDFLQKEKIKIIFADGNSVKHRVFGDLYYKYRFKWLHPSAHNHTLLAKYLRKSHLFISGRWHASILSLINETPVILFGSDSHKVKALNDLYDNIFPYFSIEKLSDNSERIIQLIQDHMENPTVHQQKIKEVNKSMKKYFQGNIL